MTNMERLSSIVQVRRRSVLADAKRRGRRRDADTRVSGFVADLGADVIGRMKDSDYKAFDDRVGQLNTKINAFCIINGGVEDFFSKRVIRDECLSSNLADEWATFRSEWNDLSLKPTIDDYNNKWVPNMDRFEIRYKTIATKSDAEKALSKLPSDYGNPLSPVTPGEVGPTASESGLPTAKPPPSTGSITTTVIVFVVAAVAAIGGYFLFAKGV